MSGIFTFEKIYRAYLDCRKTKRKTVNALKFEYNLERNLFLLQKELETRKYKPGRSICFVVTEPCPREIFAASFRDRVAHHILVREIEAISEKIFIFDSFACRKGKGTHSAVERLKSHIKKEKFYMQLDISGFFMAIDHNILYSLFEKMISKQNKSVQWREDILWLAKIIIFQKPISDYAIKGNPNLFNLIPPRKSLFSSAEGKGLPIGNYSSQFFGNLYLNELDQFIKRELKCKNYVRYVDDFILLDKSETKLRGAQGKINRFLKEKLCLELNLKKTKLQPICKGIDFLGYFVKPNYILVRQRVVEKLKSRLSELRVRYGGKYDNINEYNLNKILATINSYYGHFGHAFSFNLRKAIFEKGLGGGLRWKFLPSCPREGALPDYKKLILKKVEQKAEIIKIVLSICTICVVFGFLLSAGYALADDNGNCASGSKAWSEKAGFISFNGAGAASTYGVTVTATGVTGYAWGAEAGWIHMSGTYMGGGTYGVVNDGTGKLSGSAWGEKVGFINFAAGSSNYSNDSAANYGVSIDGSGNFSGYAWGDKTGWIHFSGTYTGGGTYSVTTNWRADTAPPTTTATATAGGAGYTFGTWTSGPSVSVTLACDDGAGLGCDTSNYPKYCVDTTDTCNPATAGIKYTAPVSVATGGLSYIRYYSADIVPNTETVKSSTIKIDAAGPSVSAGADQTKSAQFTQTGSATDADTSVASYQWSKVSGSGTITFGSATSAETTISASANDTYVIRLTATDTLGNTGTDDFTLIWSVATGGGGGGSTTPPVATPNPPSPEATARQGIIQQIAQQVQNIANALNHFGAEDGLPQINYPPIEESVPKEPQIVFQGGNIISVKEFERISILPLPQSIKNLALKFPSFASTLEKVGISKPQDVEKLKVAFLTFPSLSEVAGVPANLAFSKFTEEQKQKIPSNITFAKTGADNIDFNIKISVSDINKPVQSIATIQNKPLYLTVKPDNPASGVKGYIIFKSANSRAAFMDYTGKLSAGLSASLLDATNIIKKLDPSNNLPEVTAQKDIVLSEFDYVNNGGIWTAQIDTPAVDGKYEVRTVIKYKEPTADNKLTESLSMILVVDPEGYVYEKTAGNKEEIRIGNAKASIWWLNPETKKYQLWPAKEFQQENPQITDVTGKYSFLVPVGTYYITAEAADYLSYKGSPFQVQEGSGIHQNIELKAKNWWLKMLTAERIMLGIVIIILIAIFSVILLKKKNLK